MNRRSEKLDKFLGKYVSIVFTDGDVKHGLLEFGRPYWGLSVSSGKYSIESRVDGEVTFFRKSHVKIVKGF